MFGMRIDAATMEEAGYEVTVSTGADGQTIVDINSTKPHDRRPMDNAVESLRDDFPFADDDDLVTAASVMFERAAQADIFGAIRESTRRKRIARKPMSRPKL